MATNDQKLNQNLLIQIANSIPDYKCRLLLTYLGIYYENLETERHLGDKFTKDGNTDCIGGLEFWNNNILSKLLKTKAENERDPLVKKILEKGLQIGGPDKAENLRAEIASLPQNEMFNHETVEQKNEFPIQKDTQEQISFIHDNQQPEFHNSLDNLLPKHKNHEDTSYTDKTSSNGHFDMPAVPSNIETMDTKPIPQTDPKSGNIEQHTFEEMLGEFDYIAQKEKDSQYEEEFNHHYQHNNNQYEDLALSEESKQHGEENEPSIIIYIVIGISCLIVLIALIYLIVYCCRKNTTTNIENQDRQKLLRQINDEENATVLNSTRVKKYNINRERKK